MAPGFHPYPGLYRDPFEEQRRLDALKVEREKSPKPRHQLNDVVRIGDASKDGVFEGSWSGCEVKFTTPVGVYVGRTELGVKGINVPCVVYVVDGQFSVEVK